MEVKRTAHVLGRQDRTVQPKPVSAFAGGKALREDLRHVLRRDADAIVAYLDHQSVLPVAAQPHGDLRLRPAAGLAGLAGVFEQIKQDL